MVPYVYLTFQLNIIVMSNLHEVRANQGVDLLFGSVGFDIGKDHRSKCFRKQKGKFTSQFDTKNVSKKTDSVTHKCFPALHSAYMTDERTVSTRRLLLRVSDPLAVLFEPSLLVGDDLHVEESRFSCQWLWTAIRLWWV